MSILKPSLFTACVELEETEEPPGSPAKLSAPAQSTMHSGLKLEIHSGINVFTIWRNSAPVRPLFKGTFKAWFLLFPLPTGVSEPVPNKNKKIEQSFVYQDKNHQLLQIYAKTR